MKQLRLILVCASVAAMVPVAAWAQGAPRRVITRDSAGAVPAQSRPPRGMCRVWIDGVPATQQPAATDCSNAVKNRPVNGRVLFGDDYAKRQQGQERQQTQERKPAPQPNVPARAQTPPPTTKRRPPSGR